MQGRGVFEAIIEYISTHSKTPDETIRVYKIFQDNNNNILGHYFRNLYQALKLIDGFDDNNVTPYQKKRYASILRAQLSSTELSLLFLNCLKGVCDNGKFKDLLIEYRMLEHIVIEMKNDETFTLSDMLFVSKEMVLQYQFKEKFSLDLIKCFGGAFGNNKGIPYKL